MTTVKKSKATTHKKKSAKGKYKAKPFISYTKKPDALSVEEWQSALRKQIAEKSDFTISNNGEGLVYSDYSVHNLNTPKTLIRWH